MPDANYSASFEIDDFYGALKEYGYTYTNDQGFGGFTVFDAGAAYDFGQLGFVQKLKLSLNVTNLGDKRYASNLDSSVFAPTDAAGKLYVFHASAPRQAFISLDARF